MPITISPQAPFTDVGPGFQLDLNSDFIGPLPTGSTWTIGIFFTDSGNHEQLVWQGVRTANFASIVGFPIMLEKSQLAVTANPAAGSNVKVTASLSDTTNVLDTGQIDLKWNPTQALGEQAIGIPANSSFTADDRALLNQVAAISQKAVDAVTVALEFTANPISVTLGQLFKPVATNFFTDQAISGGETCLPVRYDASLQALYGVTVLVTQFPETWNFGTPDGEWGFHDLAVISFWVGGTRLARHGIHTLSFNTAPLPGTLVPFISQAVASIQPPDYEIRVDWAEGVCGIVTGQVFPV